MTILSASELRLLHDVSIHKNDIVINSSIEVTENEFIKKYYKDAVFSYLLEQNIASPSDDFVDLLLDGGFYEDAESPPTKYHINGLKKAIALLVYCDLIIKQTIVTRYGATNKNDQYSVKPNTEESDRQIYRYRTAALQYLHDIDFMLINIDETEYSTGSQAVILKYREDNNDTVRNLFDSHQVI